MISNATDDESAFLALAVPILGFGLVIDCQQSKSWLFVPEIRSKSLLDIDTKLMLTRLHIFTKTKTITAAV
jgi:hypothetical protein